MNEKLKIVLDYILGGMQPDPSMEGRKMAASDTIRNTIENSGVGKFNARLGSLAQEDNYSPKRRKRLPTALDTMRGAVDNAVTNRMGGQPEVYPQQEPRMDLEAIKKLLAGV